MLRPRHARSVLRRGAVRFGVVLAIGLLIALATVLAAYRLWVTPAASPSAADGSARRSAADVPRRDLNVVIVLIDTLRADHLGIYGHPHPTSPNIDALAAEAVVFDDCSAAAPWTPPSTASLLTGTPACEHGVLYDGRRLHPQIRTLAERLRAAGWRTASYYTNPFAGPMTGLHRGYEDFTQVRQADGQTIGAWLDQVAGGAFHLYIHNTEPHNPWEARPQDIARFGRVGPQLVRKVHRAMMTYRRLTRVDFAAGRKPGTTDNTQQQAAALRRLDALHDVIETLYDARVFEADRRVGSIVTALKQRGLWDNTLFLLVADHGEEMSEHGGWLHDQSVYQELLHVPLIVHFPRGRFAGRRISTPVSLLDVVPTVLRELNIAPGPRPLAGLPLQPLLTGGEARNAFDAPRVVALRMNRKKYFKPWKLQRGDDQVVIRQGVWKGIYNAEIDTFELYRLDIDPRERHDLSQSEPQRSGAWQAMAAAWFDRCGHNLAPAPSQPAETDEKALQALRGLGYVGDDHEDDEP